MFIQRKLQDILTQPWLTWNTVDIIVKRVGNEVYLVDSSTGKMIDRSKNHSEVLQELINRAVERAEEYGSPTPFVAALMARLEIKDDVYIPDKPLELAIIGNNPAKRISPCNDLAIIVFDSAVIDNQLSNWKAGGQKIILSDLVIQLLGTYDKTPLNFKFISLFLDNVYFSFKLNSQSMVSNAPYVTVGGGGSPAWPLIWRNVSIDDGRDQHNLNMLFYIWHEYVVIDGLEWLVSDVNIDWKRGFSFVNSELVHIKNVNMWLASTAGTYDYQYAISGICIFENVKFYPKSKINNYHMQPYGTESPIAVIRNPVYPGFNKTYPDPVTLISNLKIHPDVRVVIDGVDSEHGVATLSGDGTTTEFKIGTLSYFSVADPSKAMVLVTPASPDAQIPCVGYLKDDDGDGIYESVYVKFVSAPPTGTNNIKILWEVRYVMP